MGLERMLRGLLGKRRQSHLVAGDTSSDSERDSRPARLALQEELRKRRDMGRKLEQRRLISVPTAVREVAAKRKEEVTKEERTARSPRPVQTLPIKTTGDLVVQASQSKWTPYERALLDAAARSFAIRRDFELAIPELAALVSALERVRVSSATGPWTLETLGHIQVLLSGPGSASWFYNDFFAAQTAADQQIYGQYLQPGEALPANRTPSPSPGDASHSVAPMGDGTPGMLLVLRSIRLTGLYGGSVRLRFLLQEDFGAELRFGADIWDLSNLTMDVYVTLSAGSKSFNSDPARTSHRFSVSPQVHVELTPSVRGAYVSSTDSNWTRLTTPEDVAASMPRLTTSLAAYAEALRTSRRERDLSGIPVTGNRYDRLSEAATFFTYGFLHTQLASRFPTRNTFVDAVQITDDYIDLRTHEGQYICLVRCRAADVRMDTEWGEEEARVFISASHGWNSGWEQVPEKRYDLVLDMTGRPLSLSGSADTPWYHIGAFNVADIRDAAGRQQRVLEIHSEVRLRELDLYYNDVLRPLHYAEAWRREAQPEVWYHAWRVKLTAEDTHAGALSDSGPPPEGMSVEDAALAGAVGLLREDSLYAGWSTDDCVTEGRLTFVMQVRLDFK